jgi:hypothetical protein
VFAIDDSQRESQLRSRPETPATPEQAAGVCGALSDGSSACATAHLIDAHRVAGIDEPSCWAPKLRKSRGRPSGGHAGGRVHLRRPRRRSRNGPAAAGDRVLFKGSRSARVEKVIEALDEVDR